MSVKDGQTIPKMIYSNSQNVKAMKKHVIIHLFVD